MRATPSRVVSFSPRVRAAHDDRAGEPVAVVAVDRLAELEHHVVGDVDGQRDRPHPGELDAGAPSTAGVGAAGSKPVTVRVDEDRAAVRGVDADRVARRRRAPATSRSRRVAERHAVGDRRLAGDAAQRQAVGRGRG